MKQKKPAGPFILAIESATAIGSVALFSGADLMGCIEYRKDRTHAKLISPSIQRLLQDLEISMEEVEAVGVGMGPGSYTGLRVGVSTAKGLCLALDKPLLALNSLEILAWKAQEIAAELKAWICPMIDARRMEVYCALWNEKMELMREAEAKIIEEGAFEDVLAKQKILFLGDGAAKCKDVLHATSENAILYTGGLSSAMDMGRGLYQKYQAQAFENLITFEPFYLKQYVATQSKKNKLF